MKYKISSNRILSTNEMRKSVLKWIIYCICLLLFYMIMRSGAFSAWQPFLIIPLAISVSLYERELPACIFALFSGYFIDISCRFIFGFSAVWLMLACVAASLLSRNLIRVNLLNFLWINAFTVLLEFSMHYLFNVLIWDISGGNAILDISIVPTVISTVLLSPLVYLIIKAVYGKLGQSNNLKFYTPESISEDEDTTQKNS